VGFVPDVVRCNNRESGERRSKWGRDTKASSKVIEARFCEELGVKD
jgi:hypothetical protein